MVKPFPLTHIRDDRHLGAALGVIDRLLQEGLDAGQDDDLDALTDLVETYENKHVLIPDASGADVLRELMGSNRLSQSMLAKKVGISQPTLSAILSGKRSFTTAQVDALARYFRVPPAVFFPA